MTAIGIVSPGFASQPGGVTDHTSRLVQHWSHDGHEVLVAGELGDPNPVVAEWQRRKVGSVLLQYVPFLYGRRGISSYPERLVSMARESGMRVVVFVHEPWVPFTRPQWWITGPLQRRQLRRLVKRASASVTPVPAWQSLLDPPPSIQYVGSTLATDGPLRTDAQPLTMPVVFSPFSAGLNWRWIAAAVTAIGAGLTVVGATEDEAKAHTEVSRWIQPGWDWRGRVSPGVALNLLSRARLVLAPFIDGVTARRTSICAALSTGTLVVSSSGLLFDSHFASAGCVAAANEQEFVAEASRAWAAPDSAEDRERRLAWYRANLDPVMLDRQLLRFVLRPPA